MIKRFIHTSWNRSLLVYTQPEAIRMFFLGFSSGLPLLLVLGTLSFWLREADVDLRTIGMMTWVGLAYGFKWLWAPIVDHLRIPFLCRLGRRRSWLLLTQMTLMVSLLGLAFVDPQKSLHTTFLLALLTAFASATQDITLDAYRIESAENEKQAALAATYQTGYRLAMIWAGAGALALAAWKGQNGIYDYLSWRFSYSVMAASMLVGVVAVLLSPEPQVSPSLKLATKNQQRFLLENQSKYPYWPEWFLKVYVWFYEAACLPFIDFFSRYRWQALLILTLIATYRISDVVMGVMANPFYLDLGYSKEEVAAVSKVFGVVMTLVGAFLGGLIAIRLGVLKTLFLGALLSALTNILFSWLATQEHYVPYLIFTVSADNLAAGIASVAFLAYLSGLTNIAYTATQYALFSSVMLLLPKFLAGFSGFVVEAIGYSQFFILTALLGIPVLVLISFICRHQNKKRSTEADRVK